MEYQTTPAFIGVKVPRSWSVLFSISPRANPLSQARQNRIPGPGPNQQQSPNQNQGSSQKKNQKQHPPQTLVNANLTSPTVAAPTHTPSKLPSGHAARAAATQPAQASLETLTEAPLSRARSANCALPDRPAVSTGDPSHRAAAGPSMPSQIAREAAYSS